jgi:hypothetical protein
MPAMAIPSIFMPPGIAALATAGLELQSEFNTANAQDTSHAAANPDAGRSSATIQPANIRLNIIPNSILR